MPEEQKQEQQQQAAAQAAEQAGEKPATFDEWLQSQDETIRGLYEQHTAGLKSALQSERAGRAELAKQLREASKKAEGGSEMQKLLEENAGRLEEAEARAAFFEEAARPEIGCSNPRLAYLAAQDAQAIDKKGRVNWAALKEAAPELFGKKPVAAGNAGAGTQQPALEKGGMNAFIRAATGRT